MKFCTAQEVPAFNFIFLNQPLPLDFLPVCAYNESGTNVRSDRAWK